MSKICTNCGNEMTNEEKFCTVCGTRSEATPDPVPAEKPRRSRSKKALAAEPAAEVPVPEVHTEEPASEPMPAPAPEPMPAPAPEPMPAPAIAQPVSAVPAELPVPPDAEPEPVHPVTPRPAATVPVPAPVVQQVPEVHVTNKNQDVPHDIAKRFRPLRTASFVWLTLLFALPGLGLIAQIICAIPEKINRNTRNLARSILWLELIGVIVLLLAGLAFYIFLWPTCGPDIQNALAALGIL